MQKPLLQQVEQPVQSSWTQALCNMLCFSVGAGMLGLPHALLFSQAFVILPVMFGGLLCFYTAWLLYRTQIHYGVADYRSIGHACGGKQLMRFVAITLSINQVGIAVLYTITVCKNVAILYEGDEGRPRVWWYALLASIALVATSQGESITHISGMSFLGSISVVVVGLLVMGAPSRAELATEKCGEFLVSDALPGLGTAIFAFGGHPVYPDVQGSMRAPSDFSSVLILAFILMTVLFILVTCRSWQTFGCSVQGYILDDLQDSVWRVAAIVGMTLHLVVAIPVVLLPMMRVVEGLMPVNFRLVRFAVVTMTTVIAYMFPFFSDFLALMGCWTENLLVFFFPIIFHYLTFGRQNRIATVVHLLDVGILVLATAVLVLGTSTNINNLVAKWEHHHAH